MAIKIGHASIDERGKIAGGNAGDSTGKEVCTRTWYNKGWNKMLRPKDSTVAEKSARAMEQACANNNIGYDQNQRTTCFTQAKANGWDLSKINVKCECDCSSLVAVCVNAAGVSVSKDIYTGNMAKAIENTGAYTLYTDSKYLTSDKYLKRGDILVKEGSHTVIVLGNGSGQTMTTSSNLLKSGSRGSAVAELQAKLNSLGYNCGSVDGIFGANTERAVKVFQKAKGLEVDGIVGDKTRAALNSTKPKAQATTVTGKAEIKEYQTELNRQFNAGLVVDGIWGSKTEAATRNVKKGAKGELTRLLQRLLTTKGYPCGDIDGIFGIKTETALMKYQKAKGLEVDGVAGKQSWKALLY